MDLVERLRMFRPEAKLMHQSADRIEALEEALRRIVSILDTSSSATTDDFDVMCDGALGVAEAALGQTVE